MNQPSQSGRLQLGKVLTYRVHLVDRRTGLPKEAVDLDLFFRVIPSTGGPSERAPPVRQAKTRSPFRALEAIALISKGAFEAPSIGTGCPASLT